MEKINIYIENMDNQIKNIKISIIPDNENCLVGITNAGNLNQVSLDNILKNIIQI